MAEQRIFLSHGEVAMNRDLARHWLGLGHYVGLQYPPTLPEGSAVEKHRDDGDRCRIYHMDASTAVMKAFEDFGGIDLVVHGIEELDEFARWEEDSVGLAEEISNLFESVHQLNRVALKRFSGQRHGQLLFLLSHGGRVASPIMNAGKLALMGAIAEESRSTIIVLAISLAEGTVMVEPVSRRRHEKPMALTESFDTLDVLIAAGRSLHGQNIQIGR